MHRITRERGGDIDKNAEDYQRKRRQREQCRGLPEKEIKIRMQRIARERGDKEKNADDYQRRR